MKAGIKPIIGCETDVAPGSRFEKFVAPARRTKTPTRTISSPRRNKQGYKNLVKLVTAAYLEGF